MPLTAFLTFCILGLDFMIYAFFQWTYGEKRRNFARQVAARKRARKGQSASLPVLTKMGALHAPRPFHVNLTAKRVSNSQPTDIRQARSTPRTV